MSDTDDIRDTTLVELIEDRAGWLRVDVCPREYGSIRSGGDKAHGYDVVLRLDGTYSNPAAALEMAEYFREWLHNAMRRDIPGVDGPLTEWGERPPMLPGR